MGYEELRDRAALVAFQVLLQRNEHGKDEYAAIGQIAAEAWYYAKAFMESHERPSICDVCPTKMDKADLLAAGLTDQGAGPKTLRSNKKKKPPKK